MNPFTIIFGVEPQAFIPRNLEYLKIITTFESESPITYGYVITGVRGSGKTVLMTSVQNHFEKKDDWYVLRLNPDIDLYESAISQLNEHVKVLDNVAEANISIAGFGVGLTKQSFSDKETLLRKLLKKAKSDNKRILVAIDEASNTQSIKTFSHSYQAFIGEGLPLFLLMTSLPENFSSLANSKNGTFLRRLPRIKLEELNGLLIEEKYKEIFDITKEQAFELSKIVRGYSYAFQLLGALLWESPKKEVDDDIIRQLDAMLYEGAYKAIWDHLTEKERLVVIAIANDDEGVVKTIRGQLNMSANQFSPYRENLKEYGLIDSSVYGKITFCLPRFKEFVRYIERYSQD